jgi:hypothetical protein
MAQRPHWAVPEPLNNWHPPQLLDALGAAWLYPSALAAESSGSSLGVSAALTIAWQPNVTKGMAMACAPMLRKNDLRDCVI